MLFVYRLKKDLISSVISNFEISRGQRIWGKKLNS